MTDYFTYWDERMIVRLSSALLKLGVLSLKEHRVVANKTYDMTYEANEDIFWDFDSDYDYDEEEE